MIVVKKSYFIEIKSYDFMRNDFLLILWRIMSVLHIILIFTKLDMTLKALVETVLNDWELLNNV